ncbi:MAG: DUF1294 domain-containing protein [Bacteroidales bacterium]|nr:DUF1294 domain-containing protein [Bacteroidales bacterium]MCR4931347.1 DUF1294 domain-containing protein [Bacteroidales bacterium]
MNVAIIIYYLLTINLLTFVTYGIDKYKARHKHWRVREASLLLLAVLGGSPAALLAMHLFRHKTQHNKFRYGVPAILIAQVLLVVFVYKYL